MESEFSGDKYHIWNFSVAGRLFKKTLCTFKFVVPNILMYANKKVVNMSYSVVFSITLTWESMDPNQFLDMSKHWHTNISPWTYPSTDTPTSVLGHVQALTHPPQSLDMSKHWHTHLSLWTCPSTDTSPSVPGHVQALTHPLQSLDMSKHWHTLFQILMTHPKEGEW